MANTQIDKYIFTTILNQGKAKGLIPGTQKKAIDWYRNIAKTYSSVNRTQLLNQRSQAQTKILPGNMYMFAYKAKHAETLPYYDQYPIIFPVNLYSDGFLGINFHYLPLPLRARLMDALYTFNSDPKLSEKAKVRLSYGLLRSVSQLKYYEPCLKRYLYSQFRSKFIYVSPDTWDIALFLPTENFIGATSQKVWADSVRKLRS